MKSSLFPSTILVLLVTANCLVSGNQPASPLINVGTQAGTTNGQRNQAIVNSLTSGAKVTGTSGASVGATGFGPARGTGGLVNALTSGAKTVHPGEDGRVQRPGIRGQGNAFGHRGQGRFPGNGRFGPGNSAGGLMGQLQGN